MSDLDTNKIEQAVRLFLEGIGEDLTREGLADTPGRVARSAQELLKGMSEDPQDLFCVSFHADCHDIVVVRDIGFYSLCEHHLLPFFGTVDIAYLPSEEGLVCGISKLARCVEVFARRLQLQERLTSQIADTVMEALGARGVVVRVRAEHLCMSMRGVAKPGTCTETLASRGIFATDVARLEQALALFA